MHDIYRCVPQNALKVSFVILPLHIVVICFGPFWAINREITDERFVENICMFFY